MLHNAVALGATSRGRDLVSVNDSRPTVIVVEDSDEVRDVLTFLLEEEGYNVLPIEDGETALVMCRRVRPALVTLDIGLPGPDGREVLRRLKADPETSSIPVLVLTGMDELVASVTEQGADAVLVKPVDLNDLRRAMAALLGRGT